MSQHDFVIDNGPGRTVREDMVAGLQALASNNGGPTEPTTTYPGMFWLDTTRSTNGEIRVRNLANDAWISLATMTPFGFPPGLIMPYAGLLEPPGFLFCFGQNVGRTEYPALFAALGVTYGSGDGSLTFGLPDLRGRSVFGKDDMGGVAANRVTNVGLGTPGINGKQIGAAGGADRYTIGFNESYPHSHPASATFTQNGQGSDVILGRVTAAGTYKMESMADGPFRQVTGIVTVTIGSGGGNAYPHPQMPPSMVLNFIIATGGA